LPITAFQGYFNVRIESLLLGFAMRAIETTGILNTQGQIQLDHPIPQEKDRFVRVILLMSEDELNEKNWLDAVSHNPSFAFLQDTEEDIYTLNDGQPVTNEG
jgi:hypothetical protein